MDSERKNTETTDARLSVLENNMNILNHNLEKLEFQTDQNYATLHSRISDLRDDLRKDFESKNDKIIAKLEEYFRDESVIVRSSRLIDELFTFIYHNNRAEAMVGYNDDLVMSFAIGLWVRDTALRLRTEGIELTKKTLSRMQDIDGLYTPEDQMADNWSWDVNKKKESLEWLL